MLILYYPGKQSNGSTNQCWTMETLMAKTEQKGTCHLIFNVVKLFSSCFLVTNFFTFEYCPAGLNEHIYFLWFAFNERKEYRYMDAIPSLLFPSKIQPGTWFKNTFISKHERLAYSRTISNYRKVFVYSLSPKALDISTRTIMLFLT